jgi:hypothetical protein
VKTRITVIQPEPKPSQAAEAPPADPTVDVIDHTAAEPPVKEESETVKLVFDNDAWQLTDKPKSEALQLCFEAALQE